MSERERTDEENNPRQACMEFADLGDDTAWNMGDHLVAKESSEAGGAAQA